MIVLKTERLTLRPLAPGDAEAYAAMRYHPDVARWLSPSPAGPVDSARAAIERYRQSWQDRGYGPWAILLIALASALSFLPPEIGWERARLWLGGMALVVIWSAYLDYWFFRAVYRATPLAAVRDVLLVRLISWTLIFWIFAVPDSTPLGVFGEVIAAVKELTR